MSDTTTVTITVNADMLRAALICASTEQARYYLNGVYVDPKGYLVSTDGHRLFCGKIDLMTQGEGGGLSIAPDSFEGWIIPSDAIKRALAGYKQQTIDIAPDRLGDLACKPVDGSFPDWRRVVPQTLSGEIAQFNPAYIADMGKIGLLLTGKRKSDAGLTAHLHHNGEGPAGVTFPYCATAYAVLMPIRTQHTDAERAWLDAIAI